MLSRQQQDVVCLGATHVDCPRYRRATAGSVSATGGGRRAPAIPRATVAALIVLALSAGISFGFVLERGGMDLPGKPAASADVAEASAANGTGGPATGTPGATPAPSPAASGGPSSAPSLAPSSVAPSARPAPTPARTPAPTTRPSPAASGVPSADRLAVIKPCPGQAGCWIYRVRNGDNLWSIAHWFGVPLDVVYAWNPSLKQSGIQPGMQLRIPTPTR